MINKEPAVILGAISEVIRAIIPTLIIFGVLHWTGEQVAQFVLLVGVVIGALNVTLTRSQTVPTAVADKQIDIAKASNPDTSNEKIIKQAKEAV